jgi:hypothetical protein
MDPVPPPFSIGFGREATMGDTIWTVKESLDGVVCVVQTRPIRSAVRDVRGEIWLITEDYQAYAASGSFASQADARSSAQARLQFKRDYYTQQLTAVRLSEELLGITPLLTEKDAKP